MSILSNRLAQKGDRRIPQPVLRNYWNSRQLADVNCNESGDLALRATVCNDNPILFI